MAENTVVKPFILHQTPPESDILEHFGAKIIENSVIK